MKAVFTTPMIRPRSTAQTIPGSQTLRLGQPTRRTAVHPTAGSRTTVSVAAGVVAVGRAAGGPAGVAAVAVVAVAEAATFKEAVGNRMAIVRVAVPPIKT